MGVMPLMIGSVAAQTIDFRQVSLGENKTDFCFVADPMAERVTLKIYPEGVGGKAEKTIRLEHGPSGCLWKGSIDKRLEGKFYTIEVKTKGKSWGETPGVFARAVGVNGQRGAIIDCNKSNPEGWESDRPLPAVAPADLVVYELHHRDFSVSPSSGIINKGKYLALTEPAALNHLLSLGVNAVHILPSFDYASVDETRLDAPQYNWGYDPVNYNVPDGSYSTNPFDPVVRIREFKRMVQALHMVGIRVILDVVYNHTFNIEGSNFQRSYPDYYYRKTLDGKAYSNGSGCGNETASELPLMRRYMIASVKHWAEEYHIDGFRFDLMGCHDIETMNSIRKELDAVRPDIFIYGEGWSAGECALPSNQLAMKANMKQMPRVAAFSDELRDGLRGPFSDDTKGAFLAGIPGHEESVKFGIAGAIDHPQVDMTKVNYSKTAWATEPTQMMAYVSCHDDMCLVDRLRASIPGLTDDELIRLDLLAQTAVFTSQGVPFMLAGEEMLRSKQGVHNSYNSPDSINVIPWENLSRYPQVFDYYKRLLALRRHHPAFRLGRADLVRRHLEFLPAGDNVVAFRLKDHAGGDVWQDIIVVLNANNEAAYVQIPDGRYTVVCQDGRIDEQSRRTVSGGRTCVDHRSALILYR